jgi:DNA polymerase V
MIFASSSPHDNLYYKQAIIYPFTVATNSTCDLANAVDCVLHSIFSQGVRFYRCGVGAIELENDAFIQPDLFMPTQDNPKLMQCLDKINYRYGDGTLKVASEGHNEKWQMSRGFLSPQYTSQWRDIPKIQC